MQRISNSIINPALLLMSSVCFLLIQSCSESDSTTSEPTRRLVSVKTVYVQPDTWSHSFKSYGIVWPAEEYDIGVKVAATVEQVLFREGETINAGDVLLKLDDNKLKLTVEAASANVEQARANLEEAKSTYERNKAVYQSGVISEHAYLQSETKYKSSKAMLSHALSSLEITQTELASSTLKSPVSGVVTGRNVESGQTVAPSDRLGTIRVRDALRVKTFVSQKDINYLQIGALVSVTSPAVPGRVFPGRIDQLASSAETDTGNFEVGVLIDDAGNLLRDGMSATVEFQEPPKQHVLAIPREAVVDRHRKLIVYRVVDNVARETAPVFGIGNNQFLPVLSGLDSGDEIIVNNLQLVSDGQSIERAADNGDG